MHSKIKSLLSTESIFELENGNYRKVIKYNQKGVICSEVYDYDKEGRLIERRFKDQEHSTVERIQYMNKGKVKVYFDMVEGKNRFYGESLYYSTGVLKVKAFDNVDGTTTFTYNPLNNSVLLSTSLTDTMELKCDKYGRVIDIKTEQYHFHRLFTDAGWTAGVIDVNEDKVISTDLFDEYDKYVQYYLGRFRGPYPTLYTVKGGN